MFLLEEERLAALKPVSCPAHFHLVRRMSLSYRDLPLRVGELGLVHRNEQSGALHGLFRLRQFTQDDGHVFCEKDQIAEEVVAFCQGLSRFYEAFGFAEVAVGFSTRPEDRAGSDAAWDEAELLLLEAAHHAGLEPRVQPGQGAFYGPKLELALRDGYGRQWQCGTIQLDLVLAERFDLAFVDRDGQRRRPAILHRAVLGILLEETGGTLPGWLAPEQVVVLPVGQAQIGYAEEIVRSLRARSLRVKLEAEGTLGYRIRAAHDRGVAQVVVVGEREQRAGQVSLRSRAGDDSATLPRDEAQRRIAAACARPW